MKILIIAKELRERALANLVDEEAKLIAANEQLEIRADEVKTDEELTNLTNEALRNKEALTENKRKQQDVLNEINDIEQQISDLDKRQYQSAKRVFAKSDSNNEEEKEIREAINNYIRKRFNPAGVDSTAVGVTIPESISYNPQDEIKTVLDLSKYVTTHSVTTAKGKYPIRKKANAKLATVDELKKNPRLADPEFFEVEWSVDTYRGAIAISQEAIDDSAIDLVPLVAKDAAEQKLNTKNAHISDILKSFTPFKATSLDDIKEIKNKKLDRAYDRMIIASASFYHAIDTLKDKQGRYLLQEDIKSPTGYVFLGMPIDVINDEFLGAENEAKAFIGDCKRGILLSDRKDLEVRWVDHNIYGEYLRAGMRFGVTKADPNAGYLVTFEPAKTETK